MDKIIHFSTKLACELPFAFQLFTDNQLLETWLAPLADVEPITGGKYELFWEPSDRNNNSTLGCKITAIEPQRFLSFEWRGPKQHKHFVNNADPLTHAVVFFTPDEGSTQVTLIHSGWRKTAEWEEARLWQERAWRVAFENLEKSAEELIVGNLSRNGRP